MPKPNNQNAWKIVDLTPETDTLLEPEYQSHWNAWKKTPGPETAVPLLRSLDPVIDTALRSYGGAQSPPTLRGRAKLLTLKAFESYDPKRAKLRTHLMNHLQGLQRHAARMQQIIRLPERAAIESGRLREARAELADTLGREPSMLELADHTGMSVARIKKISDLKPGLAEGQTTLFSDEGDDSVAPAVQDPARQEAWLNFIYHDLDPIDQVIFDHSMGRNNRRRLSKSDIAQKLRISPGAISQRLAKIQQKIDARDRSGGLF